MDDSSTGMLPGELHDAGIRSARMIARGGSGTVFLAHNEVLGRDVAIKVLNAAPNRENQSAILSEARRAARVGSHPNILQIFNAGILGSGRPYIEMEWIPGGSLQQLIGQFDTETALRIGTKLAGAVATFHAAGIVHGDIKPANILMNDFDEPVVIDFGLGSIGTKDDPDLEAITDPRGFTPAYVAPEVVLRNRVSAASDVYSLALTLASMLTGTNPQQALIVERGFSEALHSIGDGQSQQMLEDLDVPRPLRDVLRAGLDPDPTKRPKADEFAQQLADAAEELGFARPQAVVASRHRGNTANRRVETEQREILLQSVLASGQTVLRAAFRVEDRRRSSRIELFAPLLGLVSAIVAGFQIYADTSELSSRGIAVAVVFAILVPILAWAIVVVVVRIKRTRSSSMSRQALEVSARLRNAYLSELGVWRDDSRVAGQSGRLTVDSI